MPIKLSSVGKKGVRDWTTNNKTCCLRQTGAAPQDHQTATTLQRAAKRNISSRRSD